MLRCPPELSYARSAGAVGNRRRTRTWSAMRDRSDILHLNRSARRSIGRPIEGWMYVAAGPEEDEDPNAIALGPERGVSRNTLCSDPRSVEPAEASVSVRRVDLARHANAGMSREAASTSAEILHSALGTRRKFKQLGPRVCFRGEHRPAAQCLYLSRPTTHQERR